MTWFSLSHLFKKQHAPKIKTKKRASNRVRLTVEALEDRQLLASNCLTAAVPLEVSEGDTTSQIAIERPALVETARIGAAGDASPCPTFGDAIAIGNTSGTLAADLFGAANITAVGYTEATGNFGDASLVDASQTVYYWELGTLTAAQTYSKSMTEVQDLYRFTMNGPGTAANYVSIGFWHSEGDLDLYLYDSNLNLLGYSAGQSDGEALSINGLAAGTYFVGVELYGYGVYGQNYNLVIDPGVASAPAPTPTPTPAPTPSEPPAPAGGFNITLQLSGFTASQQAIFQQAAAKWEQVITADLPDVTLNGQLVDDLVIDGRGVAIDGVNGILGRAAPTYIRTDSGLPIAGFMEFDTADVAALERDGQLYTTILHEMGHVLGIGTLWERMGLVVGLGGSDPRFVGANGTAYYNQIFGVNENSVPVANVGGPGSYGGHWRESVFDNELMSPNINYGSANPLSTITVAALADMGYTVNINAADFYARPRGFSASSETDGMSFSDDSETSSLVAAFGPSTEHTGPVNVLETLALNLAARTELAPLFGGSTGEGIAQGGLLDLVFAEEYGSTVPSNYEVPLGPAAAGSEETASGCLARSSSSQSGWEGCGLAMHSLLELSEEWSF